ncbi:MAG: hypothetical protein IPL63_01450 [Saprospiraceae bacterium]|nr:hypothetical protein [Saprospiraceae bacterium]MBK6565332.1 hypothetical protein [Saprospiraceae bacterium]MBK8080097.1 hypothetical protein [Saprospiraceae bacterium]MBK8371153.1 hypothetical protein [Saprospiraceae bacterium]MBK8546089.1 hypothetical protein [Saprospiraceae bacterium]
MFKNEKNYIIRFLFFLTLLMVVFAFQQCSPVKNAKTNDKNDLTKYEGYFMYMADAAVFKSCGSEKPVRVAAEKEYIQVERKYLQIAEGGTWVYLVFKGRLQKLQNEEGNLVPSYIIHEITELNKDKRCK